MSSPIILCTPSHCAPHHAPHLIRLYIPSGSQTWEDPHDILLHLGREIIYRDSPQMGQEAVRFHHLGGSVGPPAAFPLIACWLRLTHPILLPSHSAGGLLQILGLVERDVPCKAHKITGRDDPV